MKQNDFLADFMGNTAHARILRIVIFNESESFTAASASKRTGLSKEVASRALKELEAIGILNKSKHVQPPNLKNGTLVKKATGRRNEFAWSANTDFEYYRAIANFVQEATPARFDTIAHALRRAGKIATIVLSGTFMGDPNRPADLLLAADTLNKQRLETALKSLEQIFGREIRYAAFSTPEFRYRLTIQDRLIRDTLDFPHLVLLDRTRLL
ncbi:MAG TPA: hypothetical protein VMU27_03000 [Candidatus Paceibacterota bacterium]|nr:hypothetical protein [Candidatus Paceibacterota bacterium]